MPKVATARTGKVTRKAKKVSKTSPRKKAKKKAATCAEKGCRRRVNGAAYCDKHLAGYPEEGVSRLDRVDALRFGKIDAELRNAAQGQQLIDYKLAELQNVYRQKVEELKGQREHLGTLIESQREEYKHVVTALAKKYGIDDPGKMTIDPDNGIVRDLRKQ